MGQTLEEIAFRLGKSTGWVNARTDVKRIRKVEPLTGTGETLPSLRRELEKIRERKVKIEERQARRGEVNLPLNRSKEELEEYRRKRDAEQDEKLKALDEVPADSV